MKKTTIVLSILMAAIHFGSAQPSKFLPINDITKDKSLVTFVNQLKVAVQKKDKAFLLGALDEKVMSDLGGDGGIAEFKKTWNLDAGDTSIWRQLSRVIELGGAFNKNDQEGRYTFAFPYVHFIDLQDADDYINVGVITGKNVNIREKPDLKAKVLMQLSYDVIWFVEAEQALQKTEGTNLWGEPEWYLIETLDRKKQGWVFWKYVCSPIDYRLFLFKNRKGKWKISAFVAGE
jgi:hypothetical protein